MASEVWNNDRRCSMQGKNIIDPSPKNVKFWMVLNFSGTAPRKVHDTYESAWAECERLAGCNAGMPFFVMEAKAKMVNEPKINVCILH